MQRLTKRGLAVSQFGSIMGFARAMGWSYRKANSIINDKQEPTATEIVQMSKAFGVELPEHFNDLFLPKRPQSGTVEKEGA